MVVGGADVDVGPAPAVVPVLALVLEGAVETVPGSWPLEVAGGADVGALHAATVSRPPAIVTIRACRATPRP